MSEEQAQRWVIRGGAIFLAAAWTLLISIEVGSRWVGCYKCKTPQCTELPDNTDYPPIDDGRDAGRSDTRP